MQCSAIEMVEVSPRDGLQNEKVILPASIKLELIDRAIASGVRRIEVASFVNPKAVPQMADAEAVCDGLPDRADVTYIGLVMNRRGAERAFATGRIDQLGIVAAATDRFGIANQGQASDASAEMATELIQFAQSQGRTAQATIAVSFGCPFAGEVDEGRVLALATQVAAAGPVEISLADTIGVADPAHVARLVGKVAAAIAPIPVRVHFHNTRGTGLVNVWAALGAGASIVDSSIGGLGGCPFAPGATGNVATEDVAYMLERAGVSTGLDLRMLIETNHWLGRAMGRTLPGMVARAGIFPTNEGCTNV